MPAVVPQSAFYKSIIQLGTLGTIPVLPGITLNVNENYAVPPIIGNYWQYSFGQGFINPTLECSLVFRDVAGEVMTQAFWDAVLARSNDFSHDTPSIGDITFQDPDGSGFILRNAKFASVSLSCSKGAEISLNCSFAGTNVDPITTPLAFAGWSNANIMRFKNVDFGGSLQAQVWEWGLSFSNNLTPNMALNGSEFPADQNAGMMTASFNMSTQIRTANRPDNGVFPAPAFAALQPIQIIIAGTTKTLTFFMQNPVNNTKRMRQIAAGRVMQPSSYALLGGSSTGSPPLTAVIS